MRAERQGGGLSARLRRARELGVAGVARRVRHRARRAAAAAARADWRHRYATGAPADELLAAALPGLDRARLDAALDAPAGGFFLAANDGGLRDAFARRHPDALEQIVREADATLRGDWSWIVPGGRADWHAALPGPGRWPLEDADALEIGAERPLGDARLNWELGRCTQLVRVAQAAWCTRDPRYAHGVVALGRDFASANLPGRGIAWAHAQEVALRAVAWLWAHRLSGGLGAFDEDARRLWLATLLAHGDYVASHLADQPVTHNHLVSESAGLATLGLALPALPPAARWRKLGLRLLWRELAKQVDDEGVHGEHSTHYHAFVLDSFLAVLLLAERAGVAVPRAARERIGRMAGALALWLREDGTLPAIGDTDAGRAWRLGGDPLDRRDLLAAAAVAFARDDWGAIAGDAAGAFWLTGGRAVPGAGALAPPGCAHRFADAGLGIARSGFDRAAEIVVLRCGPTRFRPDVLRSHMHADALSLLWRSGGEDVLVDPGTYLYSEGDGWRAALRGSSAHSCVVLDGRDQADVSSMRFGISGERAARWLRFAGGADRLDAAAEHPARGAPRVRRQVAWRAGGLLAVCDELLGSGARRVALWFQLPETTGEALGDGALLRLASGRMLRFQAFGPVERLEVARPPDGPAAPGPGWSAPRYGALARGTALRVEAGALAGRLVSVWQLGDAAGEPAPARVEDAGNGDLRVEAGRHVLVFSAGGGAGRGETS